MVVGSGQRRSKELLPTSPHQGKGGGGGKDDPDPTILKNLFTHKLHF